jgi:hypothetical protein
MAYLFRMYDLAAKLDIKTTSRFLKTVRKKLKENGYDALMKFLEK